MLAERAHVICAYASLVATSLYDGRLFLLVSLLSNSVAVIVIDVVVVAIVIAAGYRCSLFERGIVSPVTEIFCHACHHARCYLVSYDLLLPLVLS